MNKVQKASGETESLCELTQEEMLAIRGGLLEQDVLEENVFGDITFENVKIHVKEKGQL